MKKTLFLVLLVCYSALGWAGNFGWWNQRHLGASPFGQILFNNRLYYFTGDTLNIDNVDTCLSALKVLPGASAYLYVRRGQVLNIHGGVGDGILPGGAGILVPVFSTLYILGEGTINVYGGKAGRGCKGMNGLPGLTIPGFKYFVGGMGGYGGYGGGGGGAGIGTRGSLGGLGGLPAICWPKSVDSIYAGSQGQDGWPSLSSHNGGKVYLVGTLTVNAYGGETSAQVDSMPTGALSMECRIDRYINHVVGGGGGGGNGNNGLPGMNFGGGGPGAGGAGSGGSGGMATVKDVRLSSVLDRSKMSFQAGLISLIKPFVLKSKKFKESVLKEMPMLGVILKNASGMQIVQVIDMIKKQDTHPFQFNGEGGQGSYEPGCITPQVNGFGYFHNDMEFTDYRLKTQHLYFAHGGKAGYYGQRGQLEDLKRTSLVTANQQMDILTTWPEELREALTFELSFGLTNIDITQPYSDTTAYIVYSEALPDSVIVPQPMVDAKFLGYTDETGQLWYDQNGKVVPNAVDSAGNGIAIYLSPEDIELEPRWGIYQYVRVNHWIEHTEVNPWTGEKIYNIIETKTYNGFAGNVFTAQAMAIPNFIPLKGSDTITIKESDEDQEINLYYDRRKSTLAWGLPAYAEILPAQRYTTPGQVRFGAEIQAPEYAVDKTTGGYYRLHDWYEEAQPSAGLSDTMPSHDVTYVPHLDTISAALMIINNDWLGTIKRTPKWLGTNIDIEVEPVEGYELDSSYVFYTTSLGYDYQAMAQTADNKFTLYATPNVDSAIVWIRYRGIKHQMDYSESTPSLRYGSMTWFVNGDSIGNDLGLSGSHEVRTGDLIWIRPEPASIGSNVCKSIQVTTLSGDTITTVFEEDYDALNRYDMHYSFVMPNEDVQVVTTYGTLSDELTTLRVLCDTGRVSVYSTRGRLLENKILADKGYKVDAGQLVWIEIENDTTLPGIDSVRLRYYDGSECTYEPIESLLFIKTMQPLDQPIDTTIMPKLFPKFMFRIPSFLKGVTVEIHHVGSNMMWEKDPTGIIEQRETWVDPKAIYDVYGRYWGTQPEQLPNGVYIRGGKKMIVH